MVAILKCKKKQLGLIHNIPTGNSQFQGHVNSWTMHVHIRNI